MIDDMKEAFTNLFPDALFIRESDKTAVYELGSMSILV